MSIYCINLLKRQLRDNLIKAIVTEKTETLNLFKEEMLAQNKKRNLLIRARPF